MNIVALTDYITKISIVTYKEELDDFVDYSSQVLIEAEGNIVNMLGVENYFQNEGNNNGEL